MKRDRLQGIGFLILALGAMMGDSENLLIPTIVLAAGAAIVIAGMKREKE